jgi:hypothetical protein
MIPHPASPSSPSPSFPCLQFVCSLFVLRPCLFLRFMLRHARTLARSEYYFFAYCCFGPRPTWLEMAFVSRSANTYLA